MSTPEHMGARTTWLDRIAPFGGIVYVVALLILFFTSEDYGDTPASVLEYAEGDKTALWAQAFVGLGTPLLLGLFVAALVSRLAAASTFLRTLTVVGGSALIALVTIGLTIWSAPLLDDDLDEAVAQTYLGLDDFGWVTIGAGGVGASLMILGASLAALQLALVPRWLGWVGVALGVVALASVAAIGLFAWLLWVLVAAVLLVLRPERPAPAE